MTFDLTKITTPFGLLDEEHGPGMQAALKAHGGPYECFGVSGGLGWQDGELWNNDMEGFPALAWRVKPAPPKPREWWLLIGDNGSVRSAAATPINTCGCHDTIIHVIEKSPK